MDTAFQDHYPDDVAHCYGCGRLNEAGHHFRTFWDGDETVTRFTPPAEYTVVPGIIYGGLLASLVDCAGMGSAVAAAYRAAGRAMDDPDDDAPPLRFVTGRLEVDYVAPTPAGVELVAWGRIDAVAARKVVVSEQVYAGSTLVVRGRVVAVLMPDKLGQ